MAFVQTTPGWPIRSLRVAVALVLVGVAGWYSPWVTASMWHVFHPLGWVQYRGLRLRVPWPWTASANWAGDDAEVSPQGLALRKMPPTLDRRIPPESIFVTVISPDAGVTAEEQTARWLHDFRASHPGAQFRAAPPAMIPAGAECLGADNPARRGLPAGLNDLIWTCISMSGGWVANFEGYERDDGVFFGVVGALKTRD